MTAKVRMWVLGALVWTLLALLIALQQGLYLESVGQPVAWNRLILSRLADWYTCAIFTPAYFWLVRRWPIDREHWPRAVPIYLLATSVFVVIKYALYVPITNAIYAGTGRSRTLGDTLASSFIFETVAFGCLLGIVQAVEYYSRLRERELQTARLASQLSDARLAALAAQLHPHFLFNTLQAISTLIHRDAAGADQMLARLSALLRRTLQRGNGHEVTLREELELLDLYLQIVETRFADRLTLVREIPPELGEAQVPHFILQPLVENALEHGIARRGGAGRIAIAAVREGDTLLLTVTDNGAGLASSTRGIVHNGIGLTNTRHRLSQLYGSRQSLDLTPASEGGLTVTLRLPWHTTPVSAPAAA